MPSESDDFDTADLTSIFGLPDEASWQERALCSQTDPEAFFPEKGGSTREAKKICVGCEVRGRVPRVRPRARRAVRDLGRTVRARAAQTAPPRRLTGASVTVLVTAAVVERATGAGRFRRRPCRAPRRPVRRRPRRPGRPGRRGRGARFERPPVDHDHRMLRARRPRADQSSERHAVVVDDLGIELGRQPRLRPAPGARPRRRTRRRPARSPSCVRDPRPHRGSGRRTPRCGCGPAARRGGPARRAARDRAGRAGARPDRPPARAARAAGLDGHRPSVGRGSTGRSRTGGQ